MGSRRPNVVWRGWGRMVSLVTSRWRKKEASGGKEIPEELYMIALPVEENKTWTLNRKQTATNINYT